jgi:putative membrane protein
MGILIRLAISAVALWVATLILHDIKIETDSTVEKVGTLLVVAVIFGVVNAVLRPIIKIFGCWAYILTLGLVAVLVNGALFMLTSWIAGQLGLPFHVEHYWPTAVLGALVVGVVSWVLNLAVPDKDKGKDKD